MQFNKKFHLRHSWRELIFFSIYVCQNKLVYFNYYLKINYYSKMKYMFVTSRVIKKKRGKKR